MTDDESLEAGKMPLLDHLIELRRRLIYSVVALIIAWGICYYFGQTLLDFLMQLAIRLTQRLFSVFPLGVVNDAGTNQVLTVRRQPQQPNLGRDQTPAGLPVNPFKYRSATRQGFIDSLAGKLGGPPSTRLEFRTDVGRR